MAISFVPFLPRKSFSILYCEPAEVSENVQPYLQCQNPVLGR